MKQILVILLLTACLFQSKAGNTPPADSLHYFRFVKSRDMFYVPYKENTKELERLLILIRQHQQDILSGNIPVFVEGFGTDSKLVRLRSNRVKSEMIVQGALREECFRTTNHLQEGNYVTVRLAIPSPTADSSQESTSLTDSVAAHSATADTATKDTPLSTSEVTDASTSTDASPAATATATSSPTLSLRANLLRWATLTPSIGVEFRPQRSIGLLVNGSFANWGWKDKQRRYKVWSLSPEVRYYMGKQQRGFVGAMYHTGKFNYKLSATGKTGSYQGGGITGGYCLPLTAHLALDFHAALGYTRASYDSYTRIGDVNVRNNKAGKLVKNYWGINQLGVSLSYEF